MLVFLSKTLDSLLICSTTVYVLRGTWTDSGAEFHSVPDLTELKVTQRDQKMAQRTGVVISICSNWWGATRKAVEGQQFCAGQRRRQGEANSSVLVKDGAKEKPAPEQVLKAFWAGICRGSGQVSQFELMGKREESFSLHFLQSGRFLRELENASAMLVAVLQALASPHSQLG